MEILAAYAVMYFIALLIRIVLEVPKAHHIKNRAVKTLAVIFGLFIASLFIPLLFAIALVGTIKDIRSLLNGGRGFVEDKLNPPIRTN